MEKSPNNPDKAREIYILAEAFQRSGAAALEHFFPILKTRKKQTKVSLTIEQSLVMTPGLVLQCFALELYFKCLLTLLNKSVPHTHDFTLLFNSLSEADRQRLTKYYNRRMGIVRARQRSSSTAELPKLQEVLAQSVRTFERARYFYERPTGGLGHLYSAGHVDGAVKQLIIEMKPEWASLKVEMPSEVTDEVP